MALTALLFTAERACMGLRTPDGMAAPLSGRHPPRLAALYENSGFQAATGPEPL